MKILIGCDVGTSGTKAVAVTPQGNILAHSYEKYGVISPRSGWAEQDADVWFQAVQKTLKTVIAQVPESEIEAICISALYGGTGVLCDEAMEQIRPPIIWMDRRAEAESQMVRDTLGTETVFKNSGNGIDSYFGYTKLLWVREHEPENWNRIAHIVPVHSYFVHKLTGVLAVDHCSAGNVGGIYDIHSRSWSESMCRQLGIPYEALPQNFLEPYEIVGNLLPEYQNLLGLSHPCPLCMGTVDCISSMLSAGIIAPGDNAAILGTSLNWGHIHGEPLTDPGVISMPYCVDSSHLLYTYGGASTAGALPRWFLTSFLKEESQALYEQLEQEIMDQNISAGADGLVMLPYFMGERTPIWDDNACGTILGLSLRHNRAHIYRALLESVAYAMRHIVESMTTHWPDKIVLLGGGAKSKLWRTIFADVMGVPVYVPTKDAEAPLGDAFLAGIGSGAISGFEEIANWITFEDPVIPDAKRHSQYAEYFALYKSLYPALSSAMKKLKQLQN